VQTGVGDRYVLERMLQGGYTLGGEQSGHVIDSLHATTGDGVLTSLRVAARMKRTGKSLAELASVVTRLPQTLINVRGVDKVAAGTDKTVQDAVAAAEARLGETGRVLLRPSGTEPVVRVMVEAATQEEADEVAGQLAGVVKDTLSSTFAAWTRLPPARTRPCRTPSSRGWDTSASKDPRWRVPAAAPDSGLA
ncbi:MAG: Phosphoglucosamine mutase, partial [Actinomyces urogenitalis DORA_12]